MMNPKNGKPEKNNLKPSRSQETIRAIYIYIGIEKNRKHETKNWFFEEIKKKISRPLVPSHPKKESRFPSLAESETNQET